MHGFHMFGNVEPTVSEVVEWLNCNNVADEGVEGTAFDEWAVREEHAREDDLEWDLDPHVKHDANKIILSFSDELFLCEFVIIIVLVDKDVMQSEYQMSGDHSGYAGEVRWQDGCDFPKESWHQE